MKQRKRPTERRIIVLCVAILVGVSIFPALQQFGILEKSRPSVLSQQASNVSTEQELRHLPAQPAPESSLETEPPKPATEPPR